MKELNQRDWSLILISSVVGALLSKALPEQSLKLLHIEPFDAILTAFLFGLLIVVYIAIFLWFVRWIINRVSKLFPEH